MAAVQELIDLGADVGAPPSHRDTAGFSTEGAWNVPMFSAAELDPQIVKDETFVIACSD